MQGGEFLITRFSLGWLLKKKPPSYWSFEIPWRVEIPASGVPMRKVIEIASNASFGITRRAYWFLLILSNSGVKLLVVSMIAGQDAQTIKASLGSCWSSSSLPRNLQELMSRELYDIEILFKLKQGQDWQHFGWTVQLREWCVEPSSVFFWFAAWTPWTIPKFWSWNDGIIGMMWWLQLERCNINFPGWSASSSSGDRLFGCHCHWPGGKGHNFHPLKIVDLFWKSQTFGGRLANEKNARDK